MAKHVWPAAAAAAAGPGDATAAAAAADDMFWGRFRNSKSPPNFVPERCQKHAAPRLDVLSRFC